MAEESRQTGEGLLRVRIVSPDGILWEGDAAFAVLPAIDGEVGVYPGHAPLLARLGPGEARIHAQGTVLYFAVFDGFLEVVADRVQVLVGRAETPGTIDAEAARKELEALRAPARRDVAGHELELRRRRVAETRLKVAARKP